MAFFCVKNKYNNKATKVDGYNFASRLEADTYSYLKYLEGIGDVSDIRCQVQIYLTEARIIYKPDFEVVWDGQRVLVESKGIETSVWRIKRRLFKYYGPCPLKVFKRSNGNGIFLSEVIIPKNVGETKK